ncbi:molecular chaperone DnaJ [Novosphingobium sp. PC22D]|uniref:J domain-containing protein n=1 Tax=Novosphingobium sp. PC22D TaxID=1962403 RepID=UPI000BEF34C7|nr:molecular chaperone DnaJ [Novosphingobium sp. PC22D]PEQ12348.1 molecular chaperone DnaJ [Novosphingobium sp. PC22D]
MAKLIWLLVLAACAYRLVVGRWPFQPKPRTPQSFALAQARALLGVGPGASRKEIIEGHRRLIASVHPDRGGTNEKVHEANAARDMLLANLPVESQE